MKDNAGHLLIALGFLAVLGLVIFKVVAGGGEDPSEEEGAPALTDARPVSIPRYEEAIGWGEGVDLYLAGKFADAEPALLADVDRSTGESRAASLYALGLARRALGRNEAAADAWDRLLAEHPESPYCGDALYATSGGDDAKGRKHLESALERYPASVGGKRAARILAPRYLSEGKKDRARRAYSIVLRGPFDAKTKGEAKRNLLALNQEFLAGAEGESYVVRSGDSLWKIARQFGTTPGFLKLVNGCSNNIRVGQRLRILRGEFLIHVDLSEFTLRLFVGDDFVAEWPVGLGAPTSPTPLGEFVIETKQENPTWYYNGEAIPFGDPRNILGTRWMGFADKPGVTGYGIHGTAYPESIGRMESSGCVRMRNEQVAELFDLVAMGTRVVIEE